MASINMPLKLIPKPFRNFWSFNRNLLTFKSSSRFASSNNGHMVSFVIQSTVPPCDRSMPIVVRRSGNYKPTTWNFEFIQSLNSEYSGEKYTKRAAELKMQLKIMLKIQYEPIDQLEFIDELQKLGISYHFECEIKQILTRIYEKEQFMKNANHVTTQGNLYTTSLQFRLLRQHGFKVPQEVFDCFKNVNGEFKSSIENDTKGLLQLYEAAHLLIQGESTLELAREFTTTFLRRKLDDQHYTTDQSFKSMIYYALEQPLHWRTQRPNVRLYIDMYEMKLEMNPIVLEFAKLDFNILQATHQDDLKQASRWWKGTSLAEKLPFARDRLVECYIWTIGGFFEPQYGHLRIMGTKVNAFITIIDDIYDVYGTLDELLQFTDVIQRWDIDAMDQLPHYMQVCFLALNNFVNEMAYDVLKDQGFAIIPYLRKSWQDLCNAFLQEAKWYYESYTPGVEEYINNGWISSSVPVILTHAFFLSTNSLQKNVVESLYKYHDLIHWSGMLLRQVNDVATSSEEMKRGDVPGLLQCYMNETGVCENEARGYARSLIRETWKKINEERVKELPFSNSFIRSAVEHGRMTQYMYQHGDGHGVQNPQIKRRIKSLLFESIRY